MTSNPELEQFAHAVSHDLREPLRMVNSYLQLLQRRYGKNLDAEADEMINYAVDGARRMQLMIDDLLVYSRVDNRGRAFATVDSNAVVDDAIAKLDAAIVQHKVQVTHDLLPAVRGDRNQLAEMWFRLLDNAVKFHGDDSPRIHISATPSNSKCQFSVRDNGVGIDPKQADRVFLIFQRLHGNTEYPGTGMGLPICKRILDRHGGRIWHEPVEGGTIFHFTVPMPKDAE